MEKYGVIMAGGGGTRFWPLSRRKNPKQLLKLDGKDYMINSSIKRLQGCLPKDHILIVTNSAQAEKMRKITEDYVEEDNILIEPCGKNTAACIGYAAIKLMRKYGDGVMVITPSDAYIKNVTEFQNVLKKAVNAAEKNDTLVTIGIKPHFPATGYGYIRYDKSGTEIEKKVREFKEKPDTDTAKRFFESGEYLWNSGIFVWKISTILNKFRELLPELNNQLMQIYESMGSEREKQEIERIYPEMQSISIDYGIMEKTDHVVVIPAEFGWSDVGSWDTMDALYQPDENGNIMIGSSLSIDSACCTGYSPNKMLVTLGLDNVVIVDTEDAIMVCSKDRVQDIRKIVDELKHMGRDDLL